MSPEMPSLPEPPIVPASEVAAEPVLEVPVLIPPPPGVEVKPLPVVEHYDPASVAKIAEAKFINNQANLQRMTPPMPGTPVDVYQPPQSTEPKVEPQYTVGPPPPSVS